MLLFMARELVTITNTHTYGIFRLTKISKCFPYINEEAEGSYPANKNLEKYMVSEFVKDGFICLLDMNTPPVANICITSFNQSWGLSSIRTRNDCQHKDLE